MQVVRNKQLISLDKAKDIGLLCKITDEDSYKEINAVFTHLPKSLDRTLWLMGYCDGKIVPYYCLQQLTADFFCNKDLNWFGRPIKVQITDYISREFDMLIDFTHDENEPVKTILSLSNARFITGSNPTNYEFYDLFIDTDETLSHRALVNQIGNYTNKLTGDNEK